PPVGGGPRIGRKHAVELGHLQFRVTDHWVIRRDALRLLAVLRPELVVFHRVDAQANELHAEPIELRLDLWQATELGSADRRDILGMREEKAPGIAQPFMKTDPAFGRIGLEIRSNTSDLQSHSNLLVTARLQLRQVLPAR